MYTLRHRSEVKQKLVSIVDSLCSFEEGIIKGYKNDTIHIIYIKDSVNDNVFLHGVHKGKKTELLFSCVNGKYSSSALLMSYYKDIDSCFNKVNTMEDAKKEKYKKMGFRKISY